MKQLTFPKRTTCTHIYPDGRQEKMIYGQYEAVQIVKENGWETDQSVILIPPRYFIEEVEKQDGTKIIFDEPFYLTNIKEYGDNSGRVLHLM